jgi:hypothetical protein
MPIDCGVCGGVIDWGDFGDDDSVLTCTCACGGPRIWRRRNPVGTVHGSVVPFDYFDDLIKALDEAAHRTSTETRARGLAQRVQRLLRGRLRTNNRNSTEEVLSVPSDILTRLLSLNHPYAADAADEIERLQEEVNQLRLQVVALSIPKEARHG